MFKQELQEVTTTWAVVFIFDVEKHNAQLFIENVPADIDAHDLRELIDDAGYSFGNFGIPWAAYYVAPKDEWNKRVNSAYKDCLNLPYYPDIYPQIVTYNKLIEEAY